MATAKIDSVLVEFIKKVISSGHSSDNKTISSFIENAISFFVNKHPKCLSCDLHRDMIIGLEIGRQELALKHFGETPKDEVGRWVAVQKEMLDASKNFACHYRKTMKATIEQAILECVTRPSKCQSCPFFLEMQTKANTFLERKDGDCSVAKAEICSPPPSHGAQSNGCSSERGEASGICQETGIQNPDSDGSRDGK